MGANSKFSLLAAARRNSCAAFPSAAVLFLGVFAASGCLYAIHFSSPPENRALAKISDLSSSAVFVGFVAEDDRGLSMLTWSFGDSGYYEMRPTGQSQDLHDGSPIEFHVAWKKAFRYGVLVRDNQRSWRLSWFVADGMKSTPGSDREPAGVYIFTLHLAETIEEPTTQVLRDLGVRYGFEDPTWSSPSEGGKHVATGGMREYLFECLQFLFAAKEHLLHHEFTEAAVVAAKIIDCAEDILRRYPSRTELERGRWSVLFAAFVELRNACRQEDEPKARGAIELMRGTIELLRD